MKLLKDILDKVSADSIIGSTEICISEICMDSRKVSDGAIFVAQKGTRSDGHTYISQAIHRGATAILCENIPPNIKDDITYIKVPNVASALGYISANFFDNPSKKIKLIGITGTNGKTTTVSLLYQLFIKIGIKTGLISTVKVIIDKEELPTSHTTPTAPKINAILSKMLDAGVSYCFMEVSSHGIKQKRITGLEFVGGIFTNLTHDHLDYHHSFSEYRDVKKSFFDTLDKSAFALVNKDDRNGLVMIQNTKANIYTYALKSDANFTAKIIENSLLGLHLKINHHDIYSQLIGDFNAYNLVAVYGTACLLELDEKETLRLMSELESVKGRFQYFISKKNITAIVDYAHTPDALENVLKTIQKIQSPSKQVITVIGCGGNRDKSKRPIMAEMAYKLSDKVFFTSDNPRDENPDDIINEMIEGVKNFNQNKVFSNSDRKEAIYSACMEANDGDLILVAGKGHENCQEINGRQRYFNDFEVLKEFLN